MGYLSKHSHKSDVYFSDFGEIDASQFRQNRSNISPSAGIMVWDNPGVF